MRQDGIQVLYNGPEDCTELAVSQGCQIETVVNFKENLKLNKGTHHTNGDKTNALIIDHCNDEGIVIPNKRVCLSFSKVEQIHDLIKHLEKVSLKFK